MRLLETAALAALGALTAFDAIWDAGAQTIEKKALSAAAAHQMISIAAAEARKRGAFAVVDEGGDLIAFERIDGTFAASATISVGKARTAAVFQRPPAFFEDVINKGRTAKTTLTDVLPEFTPLGGGVPVTIDGKVVGAIGVSSAKSARHDQELAK
jgi:glc operon protein GlcG